MSVGERLRRARLDAGKTLHEVAAETKIQLWILEAIERDDCSRVPGGVFIRGYLTAVARAVGVHPSEVVTAYSPEPAPPPVAPPAPSPPVDPNEVAGTPLWQYVVIVAMVLVSVVLWRNMTRGSPNTAVSRTSPPAVNVPPAAPPSPPASPAPAPARPTEPGATATTGVASPPAPVEHHDGEPTPTGAPLVVQLHANSDVWVEASADGERKAYRLLMPGEDLRLDAHSQIQLLVGDASAVSYTINGMPARSLGGSGVVREVSISPADYTSLLAPRIPDSLTSGNTGW